MLNSPGPRRDPRDTFPNVPARGILNALGSNHWSGVPKISGPWKSGFQFGTSDWLASPVPEIFDPTNGVNGNPPCAVKIPFHCQPESNWLAAPLAPLPNRCPLPNGSW